MYSCCSLSNKLYWILVMSSYSYISFSHYFCSLLYVCLACPSTCHVSCACLVPARHGKYLNNELLSDVIFKVREESKTIHGHKFLLETASDYFMATSLLDWLAKVNPEVRIRFTSPHPKDEPDSLLQVISDIKTYVFDLLIQTVWLNWSSCSHDILKK